MQAKEDVDKTYVPREEDEDGTEGHLANEALEAILRLARSV